jgi:hypothetical protein
MAGLDLTITASVPADIDNSGVGAQLFRELAVALQDQLAQITTTGVFADRPAAGVAGRRYTTTDLSPNVVYVDTGSTWLRDSISALGVSASDVAASLKPSGTAVAADEALRAIGTTAGTAADGAVVAGYGTRLTAAEAAVVSDAARNSDNETLIWTGGL